MILHKFQGRIAIAIAIAIAAIILLAAAPALAQCARAGEECFMQSISYDSMRPASDEDTELLICRLKQWTTFFLNLRNCELTDRLCRLDKFLTLLIGLNVCYTQIKDDDDD